jgi:hypothetical protein
MTNLCGGTRLAPVQAAQERVMRFAAISAAVVATGTLLVSPVDAGQRGRGAGNSNAHAAASHTPPPKTTSHGNPHTTTRTTTTVNPIAQKLQGKPLGDRIQKMLPAGMTLDQASSGFRNQGQFIAAVHVSQNLGIPFADLKAAMLGRSTNGATTSPMSLGQAIQKLRPTVDSTTAVRRAETEAADDTRQTSKKTTTSSKKKTGA